MARVPLRTRDDLAEQDRGIFDRLERDRAAPVGNLFRALANAPHLLERRLGYSTALRNATKLDPRYRELAIMTVGRLTEAEYEFVHHWKLALKVGVRVGQLENLADFETSPEFDDRERAVMRYASEATQTIKVCDATWAAIADFLDATRLVELVLNVAWYNQTARVLVPLQIELEAGFSQR
jgi:alkylhydroperoxidase family enzyme